MESHRPARASQTVVTVVTVAAVAVVSLNGHVGPTAGVGVAGIALVAVVAVLDAKAATRQGRLSPAEHRHNLAVVLRTGHALTAVGLGAVAVGAVLTVTGGGDQGAARVLLMSVGPFALAGGLGMYTGWTVVRRELARSVRSGDPGARSARVDGPASGAQGTGRRSDLARDGRSDEPACG